MLEEKPNDRYHCSYYEQWSKKDYDLHGKLTIEDHDPEDPELCWSEGEDTKFIWVKNSYFRSWDHNPKHHKVCKSSVNAKQQIKELKAQLEIMMDKLSALESSL